MTALTKLVRVLEVSKNAAKYVACLMDKATQDLAESLDPVIARELGARELGARELGDASTSTGWERVSCGSLVV